MTAKTRLIEEILKYADKRGIQIPSDILIDISETKAKAIIDALKIDVNIPIFSVNKPGLVPAPKKEGLVLTSKGWKTPKESFIQNIITGVGTTRHSNMKGLDYASSGHIGFAGLEVNNVFTDYQTTNGMRRKVVTKTADYIVTATDEVIVCNKLTAMTITLPSATGTGQTYAVANINTGVVTLTGGTINGEANQTIDQWAAIQVVDYATGAWVII